MTDTIHRNVAVDDLDDLDSAPAPSPTPDDLPPGRGRWVAAGVALALGAGATVAFVALRDDDRNPPPTPTASATTSAFSAEQRQAVPPAMQVSTHERQILQEAAERAQIAEWARSNGLTGLSPASVHGGALPT